jgi:hypothetical protein
MRVLVRDFGYDVLDRTEKQIRLLHVKYSDRASTPSDVHLSLKTYSLASAPAYVALSYRWGDSDPTYVITIGDRQLVVRRNLFHFLECLKMSKVAVRCCYWIDQISINQENIDERNEQVQHIGDIFLGAHTVQVWLGQCMTLESPLVQLQAHMNSDYRTEYRTFEGVLDLCANPYWQRLWVVQEIILAKEVILINNHAEYPWSAFRRYCRDREDARLRVPSHIRWLALHDQSTVRAYELAPIDAIRIFSQQLCREPHDKYYALQGLFAPSSQLQVDYRKDVLSLFLDAAVALVRSLLRSASDADFAKLEHCLESFASALDRFAGIALLDHLAVFRPPKLAIKCAVQLHVRRMQYTKTNEYTIRTGFPDTTELSQFEADLKKLFFSLDEHLDMEQTWLVDHAKRVWF